MLISFIGSPCSGKTTCAALVFAALKEAGVQAEFITEQARLYIAERRAITTGPVRLSDLDQILIMRKQQEAEQLMLQACGESVVVVTDSSPLNALLYMQPRTRGEASVKETVLKHGNSHPLVFHVHTVNPGFGADPNRIHDMETSKKLDEQLPAILEAEAPWLWHHRIPLVGDSRYRTDVALSYIFTQILNPQP